MPLPGLLDEKLRRLRRRVRLLMVERYALIGLAAAMCVTSVLVILSGRIPTLLDYKIWGGTILAGAVAGVLFGLLKRFDDLTIAISADQRSGSKERLSSAVSVSAPSPGDMEEALLRDAEEHYSTLRPRDVFRHRYGRPHIACLVSVLILLGAVLFPLIPWFQSETRRQEVVVMKDQGEKLVKIAKEIKKDAPLDGEEMRKLAEKLEKLGNAMQSSRMPKKQAMLGTRKLTSEIKEMQDKLARENSTGKTMEQARADLRKAADEVAREAAKRLAEKEDIPLSEAMKRLPSDQRLAELARKPGPLTESERAELEQAIGKYADPSSGLPIPKELSEALAKLAENKDYQKAMELMRQLAQKLDMGSMGEMDEELLRKQMEQLANALKDTDLDKLAKMMAENAEKLAQMSPEELENLLEEMKMLAEMQQMLAKAGEG